MANAAKTTTPTTQHDLADRYADLKTMLENRRRQIVDELHGRIRGVRAEGATRLHEGQDPGETAEVDIQEDIEFALIQMKAETLKKVDEALARLDEGRYGFCYDCGDEIAEARLRALPFAVRCKNCEEEREEASARARVARREPTNLFELSR